MVVGVHGVFIMLKKSELKEKLELIAGCRHSTQKQKRYWCYRDAISMKWGSLGHANRKRLGQCWENKVRVAFPDENNVYTGFKKSIADVDAGKVADISYRE